MVYLVPANDCRVQYLGDRGNGGVALASCGVLPAFRRDGPGCARVGEERGADAVGTCVRGAGCEDSRATVAVLVRAWYERDVLEDCHAAEAWGIAWIDGREIRANTCERGVIVERAGLAGHQTLGG